MRVVFRVHAAIPGLAEEGAHIILRLDDLLRPVTVSVGYGQEALPILSEYAERVQLLSEPAPSVPPLRVLLRLLGQDQLRLID